MSHDSHSALPINIIGAGPVGLAAAAHAVQRGPTAGASLQAWAHARVFSLWRYNFG